MTNDEWQQLEQHLCWVGSRADLKIDGYNVTLIVVPEKPLKNVIAVYVNGKIDIDAAQHDTKIRRKFYQKHKGSLLTSSSRKKLKKESKAFQKQVAEKAAYYYYYPFWSSFKSLKSHFIKKNTSIELVSKLGG